PLDVGEATVIEAGDGDGNGDAEGKEREREGLKGLVAYMWMGSDVSAGGLRGLDVHGRLIDEFDGLWMLGLVRVKDLIFGDEGGGGERHDGSELGGAEGVGVGNANPAAAALNENALDQVQYPRRTRRYRPDSLKNRVWHFLHRHFGLRLPPGLGVRKTAIDHLSPLTVERWRLAHEAIQKYDLLDDLSARHGNRSDIPFHDEGSRVKDRIPNHISIIGSKFLDVWIGSAIAGVGYGGLHLLAWNAPFQTSIEGILWRIAASSVAATPVVLAPVLLLPELRVLKEGALEVVRVVTRKPRKVGQKKVSGLWAKTALAVLLVPLLAISPFLWFLYVLSRWYLLVECFRNVAYLPKGVYEGVDWPDYIPHIG
ncbi:MAG: hypothetical protein Q9164_007640, partial [Protoblastenia rupestris]